jgi:hypothetical protein
LSVPAYLSPTDGKLLLEDGNGAKAPASIHSSHENKFQIHQSESSCDKGGVCGPSFSRVLNVFPTLNLPKGFSQILQGLLVDSRLINYKSGKGMSLSMPSLKKSIVWGLGGVVFENIVSWQELVNPGSIESMNKTYKLGGDPCKP